MESTTVKVSKATAKKLAALQRSLRAKSLEETIQMLVKRHRQDLLNEAFGADRGKIRPFSEEDRGEDRN
ncbi:MAG: VapB-type antitoxin [Thaumarchaeota archaeon]|nr:VapB-type antitoxin [Nitrososphaerota archaeon]